jgi:DUF4097 and DUF4098 domain-containing protein YvlB
MGSAPAGPPSTAAHEDPAMNAFRPLTLIAALALAATAAAANHEIKSDYRSSTHSAVELENLLGTVKVLPATGKELVLEYTITAGGKDAAAARALAESIEFKTEDAGSRVVVQVIYPLEKYRSYVYAGRGSSYETQTEYMGRRVRVTSRDRDAADVHVDIVARVPAGYRARFENTVGEIEATGVEADLDFDTGSGGITTRKTKGRLRGDTGSGAISVNDHTGDVEADTGSGEVELVDVVGDINADTGSGQVSVRGAKSRSIKADTGSGRVMIEDSSGSLDADTGSGGVFARNFIAGERVRADTGSGGVELEGDLSAMRDLDIDTGSGGARLRTTKPLDLRLEIETGSGGIRVDLPNMSDVREDDGEFSATVGKGAGRAVISTGSGGARIEQVR